MVKLLNTRDGSVLPDAMRDFNAPVRVMAARDFGDGREISLLVLHEDWTERTYYLRILRAAPGLPDIHIFNAGEVMPANVKAIDLDGSGSAEVIFSAGNAVNILDNELRPLASWKHPAGASARIRRVMTADLSADGTMELIVSSGAARSEARIDVLKPSDLRH